MRRLSKSRSGAHQRGRGALLSTLAPLLLLCALSVSACGSPPRYQDNDLELLTRYRAQEMCSCLFVMEQTEQYCARYTVQPPDLATYTVDWGRKEVRTQAMMYWGARARFEGPTFGCRLVE